MVANSSLKNTLMFTQIAEFYYWQHILPLCFLTCTLDSFFRKYQLNNDAPTPKVAYETLCQVSTFSCTLNLTTQTTVWCLLWGNHHISWCASQPVLCFESCVLKAKIRKATVVLFLIRFNELHKENIQD